MIARLGGWLTKVDSLPDAGQLRSVSKTLNLRLLHDSLIRAGLNQSGLAEKLGVSREAVSKWLAGESFPTPDKLLRIGVLLGLPFDQLVSLPPEPAVPLVRFRRKANRKTTDEHLEHARETGEWLRRLVKYLPGQGLTRPPTLKDPTTGYAYVQRVATQARRDMGLEGKPVIEFRDLIAKFNELHAVIVPVLWGDQQHHGNALNIHLPDSQTTWVFLNLDSNAVDFKFWMAHELGHSLAPELGGETGEDFADSFAQALLFPEAQAETLQGVLRPLPGVAARVARIRAEAQRHVISPYTIRRALEEYEQARGLPATELGDLGRFMGAATNFAKGYKTIAQALFQTSPPDPRTYVAVARERFGSPFFEALTAFCRQEEGAEHFIHRVLGIPVADARALAQELAR